MEFKLVQANPVLALQWDGTAGVAEQIIEWVFGDRWSKRGRYVQSFNGLRMEPELFLDGDPDTWIEGVVLKQGDWVLKYPSHSFCVIKEINFVKDHLVLVEKAL